MYSRIPIDREVMEKAKSHFKDGSDSAVGINEEGMPTLQSILLIFTTITMCIYILIIILVIGNRKKKRILNGSFFRLVISYFIGDFLFYLEFTLFFRLRKFGYLNWCLTSGSAPYEFLPAATNSFHYYIKIVIYIGQVLFATNRLSSAMFIMKYEHYWTKKVIGVCQATQFLLPAFAILPVTPLLNSNLWARYVHYPGQQTLRLETDNMSTAVIAYIDAGCSAVANLLCLIMYVATFVLLRREYKNHTAKQSVRNMELRLLGAALMMFVVLTLNTIIQILTIIANFGEVDSVMFVNDLSYPVVDFMYSCQPWALLLTSSVVRDRIKGLFTRGEFYGPTSFKSHSRAQARKSSD